MVCFAEDQWEGQILGAVDGRMPVLVHVIAAMAYLIDLSGETLVLPFTMRSYLAELEQLILTPDTIH